MDQGLPVIILLMFSRAFYARHQQGIVDPAGDELPQPQRRHAVIAVDHGTVDRRSAILI